MRDRERSRRPPREGADRTPGLYRPQATHLTIRRIERRPRNSDANVGPFGGPASFGMAGAAESPSHHRHYEPLRRLLRLQPARDILKAPKNVHFSLALNNPIAHHRMLVDLRLLRLAETHAKRLHARPELLLARRIVLGDDDDRQSPVSPFQRRSLDL